MAGRKVDRDLLRHLTRREFLAASAMAGAGAFAAACGTGGPASTATPSTNGPVTLSFYSYKLTDNAAGPVIEGLLKQYEAKNPHVTITRQPVAFADYQKKLLIQMQGGDAPDVALTAAEFMLSLAAQDFLLPLGDLVNRYKQSALFEVPSGLRKGIQYQGKDYFIPITGSIFLLTWNAALFQKAGLNPDQPPRTWTELLDVAKKLTQPAQNIYGWGMVGEPTSSTSRRVLQWLQSGGAEFFSADGKSVTVNSSAGVDALTFWASLAQASAPGAVNAKFQQTLTGYAQGRIAMWDSAPNNAIGADQIQPGILQQTRMGAMPNPFKPPVFSDGYVVSRNSKYPDEAFKLVSWLAAVDQMVPWVKGTYGIPMRTALGSAPGIKDLPLISDAVAKISAATSPNPAFNPKWPQVEALLLNAVQSVLAKTATPKQALDKLAADGTKALQGD